MQWLSLFLIIQILTKLAQSSRVELDPPKIQLLRPVRLVSNSKPNSDIIGSDGDRFAFECFAPYPVQWSYHGVGAPEYSAITASGTQEVNGEATVVYRAELEIAIAKESHTGQYVCSSTEFPELSAFYHVYIPGSDLFVSPVGKNLLFSVNDTSILIPCVVSQKEAQVSLKKSVAGVLEGLTEPVAPYNSSFGFRLNISRNADPSGTYVCTASYGNLYRLIEYTVTPKDIQLRTNTSSCTPSPCGQNSECQLINSKPICKCTEGFLGDPYENCRKSCPNGNSDCAEQFYCEESTGSCQNPCRNYECDPNVAECTVVDHRPRCIKKRRVSSVPCGRNRNCGPGSKCVILKGQPTCICANGQTPQNPEMTCTASCQRDSDCPLAQACDYPTCVNKCDKFNPCGPNAACRMYRHSSICDCNPGHAGDPVRGCQLIPSGTRNGINTRIKPTNSSNPCHNVSCGHRARCTVVSRRALCVCEAGFSGQPPDCPLRIGSKSTCESHSACPNDKLCSDGECWDPCKTEGTCGIDAVCKVKFHSVVCTCPKGFDGDPLERCYATDPRLGASGTASTPKPFAERCPFNLCSGNNSSKRTNSPSKRTIVPSTFDDVLVLS